jgi:hypothetical protein
MFIIKLETSQSAKSHLCISSNRAEATYGSRLTERIANMVFTSIHAHYSKARDNTFRREGSYLLAEAGMAGDADGLGHGCLDLGDDRQRHAPCLDRGGAGATPGPGMAGDANSLGRGCLDLGDDGQRRAPCLDRGRAGATPAPGMAGDVGFCIYFNTYPIYRYFSVLIRSLIYFDFLDVKVFSWSW